MGLFDWCRNIAVNNSFSSVKNTIIIFTMFLLVSVSAMADEDSGTISAPSGTMNIRVCDNSAGSCVGDNTTTIDWNETAVYFMNLTFVPLSGGEIIDIQGNSGDMGGIQTDFGNNYLRPRLFGSPNPCNITNVSIPFSAWGNNITFNFIVNMSAKTLDARYNGTTICKHNFDSTQLQQIHVNYPPFIAFDLDYLVQSGTPPSPAPAVITNITNCTELQNMKDDTTLNYTLMNNIDCSDTINWNSGQGFEPIQNFNGRLEGNGYTIINLFINRSGNSALFYNASGTMYVQNVTFDRPIIISNDSLSAVILANANEPAYATSGGGIFLYNCNVYNGSIIGKETGGLIGAIVKYSPQMYDCNVIDTNLTGSNSYAGGIVASSSHSGASNIERVYFRGNIEGTGSYKGGIIGLMRDNGEGTNKGWRMNARELFVADGSTIQCTGDCTYVGGLVGYARHSSLNVVSNIQYGISHADITIIGNGTNIGGAIGYLLGGGSSGDRMRAYYVLSTGNINVTGTESYISGITGSVGSRARTFYSFYDTDKTSQTTAVNGSNTQCYGNTTLNLHLQSVYENNGWDFTTPIFAIFDRCTYPYLANVALSTPSPAWCPPIINISNISPANNTLTNTAQDVTFTATADNLTYSCDLYVDGNLNQTNSTVLNGLTATFSQPFADGVHNFELQCTEGLYYYSSGLYNYYQDTHDPQIMSPSPLPFNTTVFTNYTMHIYGNATNVNLSNVTITIFYPNTTVFYYNETTSFGDPTTHSWDWTFNTATMPQGEYEMTIYAEDNVANSKTQYITFYINNCMPDFVCGGYGTCNISDLAPCNETLDLNNCSYPFPPLPSTFSGQACNYCSPDLDITYGECVAQTDTQWVYYLDNDWATCCNVTQIASDCPTGLNTSTLNTTQVCSIFGYSEDDLSPAMVDTIVAFLIGLGILAVPFVIMLTYYWSIKYINKRL